MEEQKHVQNTRTSRTIWSRMQEMQKMNTMQNLKKLIEITRERYMSPEKSQKIPDQLRLI